MDETPSAEAILALLERILASEIFRNSPVKTRFLREIVQKTLAGEGHQLTAKYLGEEFFGIKGFKSVLHTNVRALASQLRTALREYYESEGRDDPIRIEVPPGQYTPVFGIQQVSPPLPTPP